MSASKILPGKFSRRWFAIFAVMTPAVAAVIGVLARVYLGISPGGAELLIWTVMAALASAAVCGAFYAGLRIMGAVCAAGIPAGLIYMAYVFSSDLEYRGIAGLVSGAQLAFIFFLCGALAQMLKYLASRRKR